LTKPEDPGAAITINADERGIIVTGRLSGGATVPPTRYTQALRRRAINRAAPATARAPTTAGRG
jgi:hypothetical protein